MLTLDTFQANPNSGITGTQPVTLRLWYAQQFQDVNNLTVMPGTGNTGFYVSTPCTVDPTTGIITVTAVNVFTTLDAQNPTPQSIQVFARFFQGNTPKDYLFQGWFIPAQASYPGGVITYEQLVVNNQATVIVNPPLVYWTATQVQNYFNTLSPAPDASANTKGITKLSVAPVSSISPIAKGTNDPVLPSSTATIRLVDNVTGANAGAQIAAAITALGGNGGVVDARGLYTNLTVTAPLTISSNIILLLGEYRLTCSSAITVSGSNAAIFGSGYTSELFFQNAAGIAEGVLITGSHVRLSNFKVTGSSGTSTLSRGVYVNSAADVKIDNIWQSGATFTPVSGPQVGIGCTNSTDVWIVNCDVSANGAIGGGDAFASSYDIVQWAQTASRIHIRNNNVHDSFVGFSILLIDCTDSDIMGNWVNQNNKLSTNHAGSGYGVGSYGNSITNTNILIEGNRVYNTAGEGCYVVSTDRVTVQGNLFDTVGQQMTTGVIPVGGIVFNTVNYCSAVGNVIRTSTQDGIVFSTVTIGVLANNSIIAITQEGIKLTGACDSLVVAGNVISGAFDNGILCVSGNSLVNSVITGNTLKTITGTGIYVASSTTNLSIAQNVLKTIGVHGINVTGGTNNRVQIDGNIVDTVGGGGSGVIAVFAGGSVSRNYLLNGGTGTGIDLSSATDVICQGNTATGWATGVVGAGGTRNHIKDNKLAGNTTPATYSASTFHTGNQYSTGVVEGTVNLGSGTATISTAEVVTGDTILLNKIVGAGAARGVLEIGTIVNGTSFIINARKSDSTVETNDTSTVYWKIDH